MKYSYVRIPSLHSVYWHIPAKTLNQIPYTKLVQSKKIVVKIVYTSSLLLTIILSIIVDTAFIAIFRRRKRGKFNIKRTGSGRFTIITDFGRFLFDERSKSVVYRRQGKIESLNFSEIEGIEHRVSNDYAFLSELFFGFSIFDLQKQYRDTELWSTLIIKVKDRRNIPIFTVGQYQPREFLLTWYIDLQAHLLAKVGLFDDSAEHANSTQRTVQELFRKAGINSYMVKADY